MLLDTAYSPLRRELKERYGHKQLTAKGLDEKKGIFREYLSEALKLALSNGENEDAAYLEETLSLTEEMDRKSREIELKLKDVEREFNKLVLMQKGSVTF